MSRRSPRPLALLPADPGEIAPETRSRIAEIFAAMGDANRATILLYLAQGERCVSDLAARLDVTESAVSQHLRLLRTLRLVRSRKEGRHVYYVLSDHHVKTLLRVCLDHVREG